MKKLLMLLLAMLLVSALTFSLVACGCQEIPEEPISEECTNHKDVNGDGKCDICGVAYTPDDNNGGNTDDNNGGNTGNNNGGNTGNNNGGNTDDNNGGNTGNNNGGNTGNNNGGNTDNNNGGNADNNNGGNTDDDQQTEHTHSFGDWTTTKEPACVEGSLERVCSCGEKETEVIPATGIHTIKNDVCANCGKEASKGLEYAENDGGTYTVSGIGTCTDTDIIIPSKYNSKAVTAICGYAFDDCDSLTSVTIPDSVTFIFSNSFYSCDSLASVTIPDSVTAIDSYAFRNCSSLASVNYLGSIEDWCNIEFALDYYGYTSNPLASANNLYINGELVTDKLVIPDTVTEIKDYAFSGFYSLTSVTIPDSVTYIGNCAFRGCSGLTSVTIGDSVTSIGNYAFSDCDSLVSVTIGDSVTTIGDDAFYYCTSLTSVTIGNSVTSIGNSAFYWCYKLVEVINKSSLNITEGSEDYGEIAFYAIEIHNGESKIVNQNDYLFYTYNGVNYLVGYVGTDTELTLSESYNSEDYEIYNYAFSNCDSLTSVTIPDSVTSIGDDAFRFCCKLVEVINKSSLDITVGSEDYGYIAYYAIEVHNGESKIVNQNDYLFYTYNGVNYLLGYAGTDTQLTLPESYNGEEYEIYQYAFGSCDSLTSVTIPDSVTTIGDAAFSGCSSLTSVTIGDSITSIGDEAFFGCSSLASLTIGESVTYIGDWAFAFCYSLTSVTFENPNGWWYSSSADATSGTSISSTDLSDPSTAATYLKSTYYSYYWKRS